MAIRYFDKDTKIEKYENNLVRIILSDGQIIEKAEPRRMFPQSDPDNYISFIDTDGKEIGVIADPSLLGVESVSALRESLREFYMVPVITKIHSAAVKNGAYIWDVETDHGRKSFEIVNGNRNVRVTESRCAFLRDTYDNRYFIPNVDALDKKSRKCMFSFI